MTDNLTNTVENRVLDWLTGHPANPPVLPLQIRLIKTLGSDSSPGVEVTGGKYERKTVEFDPAEDGQAFNTNNLVFFSMPATTVTGYEIWDAAGTRWWHGAAAETKQVPDGSPYEVNAGQLVLTMG